MKVHIVFLVLIMLSLGACKPGSPEKKENSTPSMDEPSAKDWSNYMDAGLTQEMLQDKILGMLVGSAIGDAMGAPTEMWPRKQIEIEYGFVDSLDKVLREPSPEGPWGFNLSPGGTTDDTRWKKLSVEYLDQLAHQTSDRKPPVLSPKQFAQTVVDQYLTDIENLKATDSFDPEPFEIQARKMTWLQEWALVAKPYLENDLEGYALALNRFYGGEMACAGMLYAPALGAYYPGKARVAYEEAFKLSIFDIGYARDITALTAAMTAAALAAKPHPDSVINVVRDIDPHQYFKSRLLGRVAFRFLKKAKYIVYETEQLDLAAAQKMELEIPADYRYDTLQYARTKKAYELLDRELQDVPFHAGEIYLVNLTALLFSKMDFSLALEFVINFARDNDTTGAVTGAILGAYYGYEQLPPNLAKQVVETNKKELDIDLESLAEKLTQAILKRRG